MSTKLRIGIDLGGTKTEAIALDPEGVEQMRLRVDSPRGDYDATLRCIVELVMAIEQRLGARASVGLGTPGALSPATGLIKNANSVWLNGRPLNQDVSRCLTRPVRIANDADCFALSEATDGAGRGASCVLGVIVGTGVGGGIVVNGRLLAGPNAIAGEWGHNPLPWPRPEEWPGPACYCGRTGCIETFLSGPGMAARHAEAGGTGSTARDIVTLADAGDPLGQRALERYEDRMARALASVINVLDPDVIVLGGGMSNIMRLYASVPRRWGAYVFSDRVATRLVRARHGDSSGVRGAAWLWPR